MNVLIVLSAFVITAAVADDAAQENLIKSKQKCLEEYGIPDGDFQTISHKDELDSPASKKVMACIFTSNKMMQNNKFSLEGFMQLARSLMDKMPDREEKLKSVQIIGENCSSEIGAVETTADEMAELIFRCLKKQAKENNVAPIT